MQDFWFLLGAGVMLAFTIGGACELGFRLADGVPLLWFGNFLTARSEFLAVHTATRYDPLLGWVMRDGLTEGHGGGGTTLTTGRFGIRLHAPDPKPLERTIPKGAILCVGDSFTAGSEVSDGESWPAQLETMLGEPTINAGAGGWGNDQIVLRAEALVPELQPKLVVVSFFLDDFERALSRTYGGINKPYFLVQNGALVHCNHPVPPGCGVPGDLDRLRRILGRSYAALRGIRALGGADWLRAHHDLKNALVPEDLSALLVARLKEILDARGIRLLVLVQFSGARMFEGRRKPFGVASRFLERIDALGVDRVNSWYAMNDVYKADPAAFRALHVMHPNGEYGHLSARGNRLIADLVRDAILGGARPDTRIS